MTLRMRCRRPFCLPLPFAACLALAMTVRPAVAQDLLIRNVSVVDVVAGVVTGPTHVAIAGGVIVKVSEDTTEKASRVVDGTGKFLVPGLWEMHAHVWEKEPLFHLYLTAGVTGVRDLGSTIGRLRRWQQEVAAATRPGPEIVTAGAPVDGPNGYSDERLPTIVVASAAEGRSAAEAAKQVGADFIKPLAVPRDAYFAMMARAKELSIPVAGHVPPTVSAREAADAGQRTIEHMSSLSLGCSSREASILADRIAAAAAGRAAPSVPAHVLADTFDESRCRDLLQHLRQRGVWVTPTLAATAIRRDIQTGAASNYPEARLVPSWLRASWKPSTPGQAPPLTDEQRRSLASVRRIVALMAEVGVPMLAGTDAGDPFAVPGYAVHRELQLLVEAGLTAAQTLRTATVEPARLFGQEATRGSIASGKRADAVLLTANPLLDVRHALRIDSVVRDGRLFTRAQLDQMLADTH